MVQRDGARKVPEDHNMKEYKTNAVLLTELLKQDFPKYSMLQTPLIFCLTGDSITTGPDRKLKR